jgi:hypothetical protein
MFVFFPSCATHDTATDQMPSKLDQLREWYSNQLAIADSVKDKTNGWLTPNNCDGMLWTGKYASSPGVDADMTAAEDKDEPGKFHRRPVPCWNPEQGAVGSQTTWSRDMGMGLMAWAYRKKQLEPLIRHSEYGKAHNWQMGEPLADGRVVYTPAVIGLLHQVIYSLGGPDDPNRIWGNIYPSGLDDYQAHLQMLDIWLRGSIGEKSSDADAIPANPATALTSGVSGTMYERIMEHAEREPKCLFYQFMKSRYTSGNYDSIVDSLLSGSENWTCQYGRFDEPDEYHQLAESIWVGGLILERFQ